MSFDLEYRKCRDGPIFCQICSEASINKDDPYICLEINESETYFCLGHVYDIVKKSRNYKTQKNVGKSNNYDNIKLDEICMKDRRKVYAKRKRKCFVCEEEIVDDFLNIFHINSLHEDCFEKLGTEIEKEVKNNKKKIISDNI